MSHRCIHSTYAAAECTIDQLMREGDAGGVGRGEGEGGGRASERHCRERGARGVRRSSG